MTKNIPAIHVPKLNLPLEQERLIIHYIEFLLKVNKKMSLTSFSNFETWFVSHIEDSVKAYKIFKLLGAEYFIDSGSGNGLPGVIFAILSGTPFTLCDVDGRKCEFLRTVCHRLNLPGKVYCGPIKDLASEFRERLYFIYRGLGPGDVLVNQYRLAPNAGHFRFMSGNQSQLFKGSLVETYQLSDKSFRFLEVSSIK